MKVLKHATLVTFLVIAAQSICFAVTVTTDMNSLPSTKGWSYFSSVPLAETGVFSVGGGILTQDTTVLGTDPGVWYFRTDVVTDTAADVSTRMRLVNDQFNTPFGAAVEYSVSQYYFIIGVGKPDAGTPAQVYYKTGPNEVDFAAIPGIDASVWHDYRMAIDLLSNQFTLFVDGISMGSFAGIYNAGVTPGVFFGDLTAAGNARVEYDYVSFTSTSLNAVPEPSTLVLTGGGLALCAWLGRRRRK